MKTSSLIFSRLFLVLFFSLITRIESAFSYPDESLYNIKMEWQDDKENKVTLADFSGRPVVLTMAFASCSTACPLTIARLKKLDDALKDKQLRVEIVIVTFDPDRDSPAELKKFRDQKNLTAPNWRFLTGKKEDIRKLSHLLSINFQSDPTSNDIIHSNKLLLLDKEGVVRETVEGLSNNVLVLIDTLELMRSK